MTGRAFFAKQNGGEADERRVLAEGPRLSEAKRWPRWGRRLRVFAKQNGSTSAGFCPGGADDRPRVFASKTGRRRLSDERRGASAGPRQALELAAKPRARWPRRSACCGLVRTSALLPFSSFRPVENGRRTRPGRDVCVSDAFYGLLRSGRASRSKALSSCSGAGTWAEAASAFR